LERLIGACGKVNITFNERMFNTRDNATWWAEQRKLMIEEGRGWLTPTSDNHLALLSAPMLHGTAIRSLLGNYQDVPASAISSVDAETAEAYARQHRILMASLATNDQAVYEAGNLTTRVILVKPLSRGYIRATKSSIWDVPAINFRNFAHPLDLENVLAALRHARRVLAAPEMAPLSPVEIQPGLDVQDDEDMTAFVREKLTPGGAHGCCAAPMGTVLDSRMRVRGVSGLRVIDTSSWPMIPGAHAMQVCLS
jgi:choline dehydrogenase-like flavoprotein